MFVSPWSLVGLFRFGQTGSSSIVRAKLRKEQAHMAEHEPDGPPNRLLTLTVNTLAMLSLITIIVAGAIPVIVFPSLSAGRPGAFFRGYCLCTNGCVLWCRCLQVGVQQK